MSIDKNQAIIEYLSDATTGCPQIISNPLFFNFIDAKNNNKQLVVLSNDIAVQRPFIDGSVLKRYTFTIIDYKSVAYQAIVKTIGTSYTNENVEEMFESQSIIDWITEQDELQHYPDFGETCEIEKITALTENPRLNGVDISVSPALARYSISIQVTYLDISKKLWT